MFNLLRGGEEWRGGKKTDWLRGEPGTHPISLGDVEDYAVLFMNPRWVIKLLKDQWPHKECPARRSGWLIRARGAGGRHSSVLSERTSLFLRGPFPSQSKSSRETEPMSGMP